MNSKELRELAEAYQQVYTPQEVDEATAMAKRGYDETKLRKPAGGGEAADRATALEKKPTYGDANKQKQRETYARKQRGDFRKTASASPGLHGYGHKSNDPAVKAKQAARGAQRGALTPAEKKQFNREDFELDQMIADLVESGYSEKEAYAIVTELTLEGYKEISREKHGRMYDRYKKLRTAAMKDAADSGEASGENRMKMGKMSTVLDKSAENLRKKG